MGIYIHIHTYIHGDIYIYTYIYTYIYNMTWIYKYDTTIWIIIYHGDSPDIIIWVNTGYPLVI